MTVPKLQDISNSQQVANGLREEGEDDAEMRGLLSGERIQNHDLEEKEQIHRRDWTRILPRRMTYLAVGLILLILSAFLAPSSWYTSAPQPSEHRNAQFGGQVLRSNGTHDFKRTVLIVSIDGLRCARCIMTRFAITHCLSCCRADYLDRGLTPHLLDISKKGLRAKHMKSVFPVSDHV